MNPIPSVVKEMARVLVAFSVLIVGLVVNAFRLVPQRFGGAVTRGSSLSQQSSMMVNVKPDLFSGT